MATHSLSTNGNSNNTQKRFIVAASGGTNGCFGCMRAHTHTHTHTHHTPSATTTPCRGRGRRITHRKKKTHVSSLKGVSPGTPASIQGPESAARPPVVWCVCVCVCVCACVCDEVRCVCVCVCDEVSVFAGEVCAMFECNEVRCVCD